MMTSLPDDIRLAEQEKVSNWYCASTRLAEILISDPLNSEMSQNIAAWVSIVSKTVREYIKELYHPELFKANPDWCPHFSPMSLDVYLKSIQQKAPN